MHSELVLMQDGAAGHTARATMAEFAERGIHPIEWPPFSPDLNPIEAVWNIMKDHIQERHDDDKMTYSQLRQAVEEAWTAVGMEQLDALIDSMHDRCDAVILAEGRHTRY